MSEQTKIRVLPDFIANQIAAGEVVQKPESVVKELVENAFDAGADTVVVLVKDAGKQLIHIVDNGSGMNKQDLTLAPKRHATSKLYTAEDLEEIRTFGFRGEALASISAVANLEIRTKTHDAQLGLKLTLEPMKDPVIEDCQCENGTQIFVRNLFYNTPARRKFLKSNLTEFRYISDTMLKFALAKPDKRLIFYDEDTLIFDAKPADLKTRINDVIGANTAKSIIEIKYSDKFINLYGYVGTPQIAKQSRSGQYLFLNDRSIVNKSLNHAVYSAFEHLIENRKHPFFVIKLELDPKVFDVNVHPQKNEVKFENENSIYSIIKKTVYNALINANLIPEVTLTESISKSPFEKIEFKSDNGSLERALVNKLTGEIIQPKSVPFNSFQKQSNFNRSQGFEKSRGFSNNEHSAYEAIFGTSTSADFPNIDKQVPNDDNISQIFEQTSALYWQLHYKYIFVSTEEGMLIIDQHAAHERILYEKASKAIDQKFNYAQTMLFPIRLNINPSEIATIKEIEEELIALGFNFELLENGINLNSVPLDVLNEAEADSFKEIIAQFEEYEQTRRTNKRDNLAASFACKAAIKTGQKLSFEEIKNLVTKLFECEMPYVCPHGRPVIIEFKLNELDKRFGRI